MRSLYSKNLVVRTSTEDCFLKIGSKETLEYANENRLDELLGIIA